MSVSSSKNVTLNLGDGWNTVDVDSNSSNVYIYTGDSKDTIRNNSDKATITAGVDKDRIWNKGNAVKIDGGEGNDTIQGAGNGHKYNSDITIIGGDGDDSIHYSFSTKIFIDCGTGNDTVENSIAKNATINCGAGDDTVLSQGTNATIIGGTGNDSIRHCYIADTLGTTNADQEVIPVRGSFYLDGGDGDDLLYGEFGDKVTLSGGSGNDSLVIYFCNDSYVNAGEGNDKISVQGAYSGDKNTIVGGKGNDTFYSGQFADDSLLADLSNRETSLYQYNDGDGDDVLFGFNTKDTLKIVGTTYSTQKSGNDVIVKAGKGSVTLKYFAGKTLNIIGMEGDDTVKPDGITLNGTTLNLDSSFSGNLWAGKNSAYSGVKIINAKNTSQNMILAGNSKSNSILGGSGKNSLWGGKGGNNTLTGGSSRDQYWFSGGGNDVVTNFKSGNSSDADVLVFYNTGFKNITRSGKNIVVTEKTGKKITLKSDSGSDSVFLYSADGKNISGAKVGESSDKSLTYDSAVKYYKLNGNGTLKVTGSDNNKVSLTGAGVTYSGITKIDASGATGDNILVGSSKLANSIVGGSGKDSLTGDNSTDYLAGGVGDDSISGGKGKDTLYGQAGNDTVRGGTGKDYVSGAAGDDYLYGDDGNDTVRGGSDNDHVYGGNGDDMVYGDKGKDYLSGGAGNDYLSGGADVDTLVGGADNDTLRAGEGNDYLSGGTGDDRLYGEDGEDTLTGGDGNDYISGGTGNDSLVGGTGKDSLHSGTGDDIVSGGDGNDKLYGDAGNDILEGEAGKDYLSGGKGDDSLYGGAGNDTVYGGEGNDYLSGGDGKDTFWFNVGGGNDTVTDYVAGNDKIQIKSGVVKSGYTDGSDVVFVLSDKKNGKDNGQIIIKDGKDKNISVVGVSGKKYTYINGTRSYTSARIDSSNDVNKSWFMTGDDNYKVSGNYNLEPQTKNYVGNLNISTGQTSNVPEIIFVGSTKNLDGNSQSGLNKV